MLWHSAPLGGRVTSPGWGLWLSDAVDFGSCGNTAGRGSLIVSLCHTICQPLSFLEQDRGHSGLYRGPAARLTVCVASWPERQ